MTDIKEAQGLEVVAWLVGEDGSAEQQPLCRLSDATAVIDQLRERVAELEASPLMSPEEARAGINLQRADPTDAVEVVAWRTNRCEDSTFPRLHKSEADAHSLVAICNNGPRITKEPLMTVAQHTRILAAQTGSAGGELQEATNHD